MQFWGGANELVGREVCARSYRWEGLFFCFALIPFLKFQWVLDPGKEVFELGLRFRICRHSAARVMKCQLLPSWGSSSSLYGRLVKCGGQSGPKRLSRISYHSVPWLALALQVFRPQLGMRYLQAQEVWFEMLQKVSPFTLIFLSLLNSIISVSCSKDLSAMIEVLCNCTVRYNHHEPQVAIERLK